MKYYKFKTKPKYCSLRITWIYDINPNVKLTKINNNIYVSDDEFNSLDENHIFYYKLKNGVNRNVRLNMKNFKLLQAGIGDIFDYTIDLNPKFLNNFI